MRRITLIALAVAVVLAAAAAPFASSAPDGLERVAERHGFADAGRLARVQEHAAAPGYAFPGVGDPRLATGLAGLAGTLLVVVLAGGLVSIRRRAT